MSSIADRLVFLRGSATQAEFADRVGINVNTLRGYEKGRALPGYEVLESLCSKLNVSPGWILTGQGNVLQEAPFSGLNETPRPLPQPELAEPMPSCDVDLIMIPMVEARLSAGHGSLEVGGDSERSYAFRSDFLHRKGNPREMVLMRVSGDSMEPEIMDNDIVLIDQGKRDVAFTPSALMKPFISSASTSSPARSSSKAPTPPTRPSNSTPGATARTPSASSAASSGAAGSTSKIGEGEGKPFSCGQKETA